MPTTAHEPPELKLRLFEGSDEKHLRQWLKLPHVVAWWGGLPAAEAAIALARETETSLRCMIHCGDDAIGYGHAIDATLTAADQLEGVPVGAFEIDLFIAEARYKGRGLGAEALEKFAEELFAESFMPAVVVRMPVTTESAVRTLEQKGFRWRAIERTPGQAPRWLLVKSRNTMSAVPQ
jgi:GNAT superfamily N-acetyltransferase